MHRGLEVGRVDEVSRTELCQRAKAACRSPEDVYAVPQCTTGGAFCAGRCIFMLPRERVDGSLGRVGTRVQACSTSTKLRRGGELAS